MKNKSLWLSVLITACTSSGHWANEKGMDRFDRDLSICREVTNKTLERRGKQQHFRPIGGIKEENAGRFARVGSSVELSVIRQDCMLNRGYYRVKD